MQLSQLCSGIKILGTLSKRPRSQVQDMVAEKKKKVAKMELRIFCKFILFFFPPIFFLTHFSNSGFGNCEQVSSPPLFAFVCPHRLCLPQVLKKILNVKQVFINLLVLKGSSVFVAQNYKCVKLINQL